MTLTRKSVDPLLKRSWLRLRVFTLKALLGLIPAGRPFFRTAKIVMVEVSVEEAWGCMTVQKTCVDERGGQWNLLKGKHPPLLQNK